MATGNSGSFNIKTSNIYISGYVSWSETYDIDSNSSVVTAELKLSRTNTGYETYGSGSFTMTINGSSVTTPQYQTFSFTYNSNTLCISHRVTVPHNADGSKSIEISVSGYVNSGNPYLNVDLQSAVVDLKTIPRASTLTVPNGTLGGSVTLTVNRASSAFIHDIYWSAGGENGVFKGVGDSYVWRDIPYAIANGNTNGSNNNGVSCSFTIITYNNGTEIGRDTASCTLYIPDNATTKPSLTLANISVTNSGNISSWSEAIKGISKLKLSVSSASGKYGATIKSYRITTTDGKSSNTSSIEVTPSTSETYTITVTATDTRGFSATTNKTISVYDYAPPVISSASVSRCTSVGTADNNGTYMKVYADYGFTNINGKNAIAFAYAEYRVSGSGSSFTNAGNIFNGTSVVLGSGQFNIGASYEVKLTVADTVGGTDTYTLTLGTAIAELNIGLNKVGIGKYAEKNGYLEVGYKTKFEDDVDFKNPEQVKENLNITPSDIGALSTSGGTVNGNIRTSGNAETSVGANFNGGSVYLFGNNSTGNHGLYDTVKGYIINLNSTTPQFNGNASTASSVSGIDTNNFRALQNNGSSLLETVKSTLENNKAKMLAARLNYGPEAGMIGLYTDYSTGLAWAVAGEYTGLYHITGYYGDWQQNTIYTSRHFAWKKASVTFSSGSGSTSASGVKTSSTVIATRGDTAMSGGNYAMVAADCNSNGTIKMGLSNTSSGTYIVNLWWSK